MDSQTMMLAGGVTAVVGIAVTAMWAAENVSFGAPKDKVAKRERGRKGDSKKKAKGDKPKTLAPQDVPSQHAAATPAVAPPAPKPAAPPPQPVPPQPAKEEGKKKGKKGGKGVQAEAEAAPAPEVMKPAATPAAAPAGKGKKGKQAAAPAPPAGEPKNGQKKAEKDKKKQDKAADLQADLEDGWCQVGKSGKPKGDVVKQKGNEDSVQASDPYMGLTDTAAVFFQVPVGVGGDFLQASVAPPSGSSAVASVAQEGGKKKKKTAAPVDLHTSSNGWSPAADEVASTVARDLASMTIAPSPVKKVAADDEWATVPVKSKKKSSKA